MANKIRMASVAVVVATGSLAGCGEAKMVDITRLAVDEPGPDAYTLTSGKDDHQTTRRMESGGKRAGNQAGLYGGTRKVSSCDKGRLVKFLTGHADMARVWAEAHHITPAAIPAFIKNLTPVVLRVDTVVTNHGYRSGVATSLQAVLQAGVSVLVDAHGLPVVKCNCGNPLTAPAKKSPTQKSRFTGTRWQHFSVTKVTIIVALVQEVNVLVLVDSTVNMIFVRPVGTQGRSDGAPAPIPHEAIPEPAPPATNPGAPSHGRTGRSPSTEPTKRGGPTRPAHSPATSVPPKDGHDPVDPQPPTTEPAHTSPSSDSEVPDVPSSGPVEPVAPEPETSSPSSDSEVPDVPSSEPAESATPEPEPTENDVVPDAPTEPGDSVSPS